MPINISVGNPCDPELKPRITVVGVGGAGGNAVNNMVRANLTGVEFVVANTDSQALAQSLADKRIQMGASISRGLGAGSRPEIGRAAAEEAIDDIIESLAGSNMVFVTGGMGGGTGTGAAPVIARAAREHGVLTVGVVTKPFDFEGRRRMQLAENGIQELQQYVDTLIVIPNQNLFRMANERTSLQDAFKMADDVLYAGVRGVTDLMVIPGMINLDFADIRAVMSDMGKAMMGTGEATGDRRALDAAEAAISNPLLDDASMKGARGVLINITGGPDLTLFEVDEAANRVREEVDPDANIIFGTATDMAMEGRIRVSVVATGLDAAEAYDRRPQQPSLVVDNVRPAPQPQPAAPTAPSFGGGFAGRAPSSPVGGGPAYGAGLGRTGSYGGPQTQGPVASPTMSASGQAAMNAALAQAGAASATDYPTEGAAALAPQPVAQPQAQPTPAQPAVAQRPQRPARMEQKPFIPPRPMEGGQELAGRHDPFVDADLSAGAVAPRGRVAAPQQPMRAAAQPQPAPAQPQPQLRQPTPAAPLTPVREPAPSLMQRMTNLVGGGRGRPQHPAEPTGYAAQEPQLAQPARAPQAFDRAPSPAYGAAPQRGLAADPGDRLSSGNPEDDLLDIPAFLRRQAN